LTIALELVDQGREVVLVDPGQPGMGASYGNAGTIAGYATSPVGTPDVLRALPSLLLSKTSPLAIRHRALPSLDALAAPLPLAIAARPGRRGIPALAALLDRTPPTAGTTLRCGSRARASCNGAAAFTFTRTPAGPQRRPRPSWTAAARWGWRSS
jgi:hypothetical protein